MIFVLTPILVMVATYSVIKCLYMRLINCSDASFWRLTTHWFTIFLFFALIEVRFPKLRMLDFELSEITKI